ncbi:MAG: hypothetical protein HY671_02740 [Chloroflexi bacterium]|nr:hypothetical protein [Chloroflexota bacterium]
MKIDPNLKCDACNVSIKKAEDALILWEPWKSYYDHQDWLKMKPVMKIVHKAGACSAQTMKEYTHSMEMAEVASGKARAKLNAMVCDMDLSKLNVALLLRRAFSDFDEAEFFKFSVEDYQDYHRKSVEW